MALDHQLRLHHEVVLLAFDAEKGTARSAAYSFALAGGILLELLLEDRIRLGELRRGKPLVELVSATQIGDPVLDDALRRIQDAGRPANVPSWVSRWARRRTTEATIRRLVHQGILRTEERRVLFLFTRTFYPAADTGPKRRLVERIREAVFGDGPVDPRTSAITSLAHAAGLLVPIFGRRELKARKERLEALREGDAVAEATRAAIQATQAAVTAAVTAAT